METEENLIFAPWTRKWVPIHFSFLPITYTGSVLWCRKQTVEPLKAAVLQMLKKITVNTGQVMLSGEIYYY